MKVKIFSKEQRAVECVGAFYPYTKNFAIDLSQGNSEVEFETEAHFNRFIQAATSMIMGGEIVIGGTDENGDEYKKIELGKATKKVKVKSGD